MKGCVDQERFLFTVSPKQGRKTVSMTSITRKITEQVLLEVVCVNKEKMVIVN